jgi:uncharacterized membrane protein (Fun14 family)
LTKKWVIVSIVALIIGVFLVIVIVAAVTIVIKTPYEPLVAILLRHHHITHGIENKFLSHYTIRLMPIQH